MTAPAATVGPTTAPPEQATARPGVQARWWALLVAAPLLFYLVPFVAGYAWNNIGPLTPDFPGMASSPDRRPSVTTAVEHYGTGVVAVPYRARLRADPRAVDGPVTVEADVGDAARGAAAGPAFAVPLASYRPNEVRAAFDAPAPGLFVVKDSTFPGWQATLNGQPAPVIDVDGLVRGVVVPVAGHYEVTMAYRPASFVKRRVARRSDARAAAGGAGPGARARPAGTGARARGQPAVRPSRAWSQPVNRRKPSSSE